MRQATSISRPAALGRIGSAEVTRASSRWHVAARAMKAPAVPGSPWPALENGIGIDLKLGDAAT